MLKTHLHNVVKAGQPGFYAYTYALPPNNKLITASPYAIVVSPIVPDIRWSPEDCPESIARKYQELANWPSSEMSDILAEALPVTQLPAFIAKLAGCKRVAWFEENLASLLQTFGKTVSVQIYYWSGAKEISSVAIRSSNTTLYVGVNIWRHDEKIAEEF